MIDDHVRVALLGESLGEPSRNTWYAYRPHCQLVTSVGVVANFSTPAADSARLKVRYKSQLDNARNPYGACNVTSVAMPAEYYGVKSPTNEQLEDYFYRWLESKGLSRHDPWDLKVLAEAHGLVDDFTDRGSLNDLRAALAAGQPCVIHGYFTSFGHIICVVGYDKDGFFVHDPYGEWTPGGYLTGKSGEGLKYSNGLIKRLCSPEGENYLWLHRFKKKG